GRETGQPVAGPPLGERRERDRVREDEEQDRVARRRDRVAGELVEQPERQDGRELEVFEESRPSQRVEDAVVAEAGRVGQQLVPVQPEPGRDQRRVPGVVGELVTPRDGERPRVPDGEQRQGERNEEDGRPGGWPVALVFNASRTWPGAF